MSRIPARNSRHIFVKYVRRWRRWARGTLGELDRRVIIASADGIRSLFLDQF